MQATPVETMNNSIIGLGHIGLPTAAVFRAKLQSKAQ